MRKNNLPINYESNIDETIGKIALSDHLLCSCVAESAKKFPGVYALNPEGADKTLDIISRDVSVANGVRITRKEEDLSLDIHVFVEYGTQIPQFAWELQKKIKKDLYSMTGQDIESINIHIEGVCNKE